MVDKFAQASSHELDVLLELLFEGAARTSVRAAPGVYFGYDPVLGDLFITNEDHSALRLRVCRALVADAKFRNEAPTWPRLPLRREDIEAMVDDGCIRCSVVGHFGNSLRGEGWSPQHPGFRVFVAGLMACRHTPDEIRSDPELRQEFPPCRLKGITGGWLTWRSPETLALDRRIRKMVAAHEAALAQERMGV